MLPSCPLWYHDISFSPLRLTWCCTKHAPLHQMSRGPSRPRRGRSQLTTARLAAVARTPQATPPEVDLLYLCDSETTLDKVSIWIGSGRHGQHSQGDANADIMKTIIECVKERVLYFVSARTNKRHHHHRGARTFMVKVLYTWQDKGVKQVSTWSKTVRRAVLKGGAEFQRQKVLNRAAGNWNKEFLRTTDKGACTGVTCGLMDSKRWRVGMYASTPRG
jgi:hypothetical protein